MKQTYVQRCSEKRFRVKRKKTSERNIVNRWHNNMLLPLHELGWVYIPVEDLNGN